MQLFLLHILSLGYREGWEIIDKTKVFTEMMVLGKGLKKEVASCQGFPFFLQLCSGVIGERVMGLGERKAWAGM